VSHALVFTTSGRVFVKFVNILPLATGHQPPLAFTHNIDTRAFHWLRIPSLTPFTPIHPFPSLFLSLFRLLLPLLVASFSLALCYAFG
jgi:hypothetical protein